MQPLQIVIHIGVAAIAIVKPKNAAIGVLVLVGKIDAFTFNGNFKDPQITWCILHQVIFSADQQYAIDIFF